MRDEKAERKVTFWKSADTPHVHFLPRPHLVTVDGINELQNFSTGRIRGFTANGRLLPWTCWLLIRQMQIFISPVEPGFALSASRRARKWEGESSQCVHVFRSL